MSVDGKKPANPFQDERAFDESLHITFHPVSGHEGRFAASHALTSIGKLTEYQASQLAQSKFFFIIFSHLITSIWPLPSSYLESLGILLSFPLL
jgi:hypothetical protein